jgi:hypothetical protein
MASNDIKHYQSCIKQLLSEYESLTTDWSTIETIFDDVQMRYIVLRIGWNGQKRIHLCLVHIDIKDDMVIVQANNTEDMLDDELVALGIPHENIHPGILPPNIQAQLQQQRCMIQAPHGSSQPTSALHNRVG